MPVIENHSKQNILLGQDNNALIWLIIINVTVFAGLSFIKLIYLFSNLSAQEYQQQIVNWLVLPTSFQTFLSRPWTLLTHIFTQTSFWHLLSNMLWLWAFGYILQDLVNNKRIIPIYLYGGLIGAISFLAVSAVVSSVNNTLPLNVPLLGAGSAIMAIAIAVTTIAPRYKIFPMIGGGIPLWILALLFVVINFFSIGAINIATTIAHLMGAIVGFVFITQLKRGNDIGAWMNNLIAWLNDLFNPEKNSKTRNKNYYKAVKSPYQKTRYVTQQRLDEILDKINQKGYDKLNDDEREFLATFSDSGTP